MRYNYFDLPDSQRLSSQYRHHTNVAFQVIEEGTLHQFDKQHLPNYTFKICRLITNLHP
jgi:hypothetical protein